jgi:hypothetical protein
MARTMARLGGTPSSLEHGETQSFLREHALIVGAGTMVRLAVTPSSVEHGEIQSFPLEHALMVEAGLEAGRTDGRVSVDCRTQV